MAAPAFDSTTQSLEAETSPNLVEAHGTARIARRHAGREPGDGTPREIAVVLEKLPPGEPQTRGLIAPTPRNPR